MTETPSSPPPQEPGTYSPHDGPPPAHAGWAVASLLFFWPLSFSAFTYAFNVYPLWARGDVLGARAASDRVRRLGQLSLWLFGGLLVLLAIVYAIVILVLITNLSDGWHHWEDMPRRYRD